MTVFNPASHSLPRFVALDAAFACGAVDEEGHRWPAMPTEGGSLVQLSVPPLGASVLRPASVAAEESARAAARAEGFVLENSRLRALFSAEGELVSLVTLSDGRERVRSASNRFHLYRDLPRRYDAWDIDSQTEDREVFPETACEAEVAESSGLRASLRFTRRFGHSMPSQTVSLAAGDTELLLDTRAEWGERHRLLKVSFDTGIEALEAAHQIQFGYLRRPAQRSRRYDMDRFEVPQHTWTTLYDATHGAAVLNDCKYGVSCRDGVIGLSLLRAPAYPDAQADQGSHHFRYAYRVWDGPFDAAALNAAGERLNIPLVTVKGAMRLSSLLAVDDGAIVTESVKLAEDGSGDLIVRLYECAGGDRRVTLRPVFAYCAAHESTLAEEKTAGLPSGGVLPLSFRAFEIKTLRFSRTGL